MTAGLRTKRIISELPEVLELNWRAGTSALRAGVHRVRSYINGREGESVEVEFVR